MQRWVAFLRGINLGRRRIKMDRLREVFEELGFASVATYIASGNVIFDSEDADEAGLEARIQHHLGVALGFQVATFLRTIPELKAIASADPFPAADVEAPGHSVHVTFLARPPDDETAARLLALETERDAFVLKGREVYWLSRGRLSDSPVSMAMLARACDGVEGSMRNMNTVRAIAEKFG